MADTIGPRISGMQHDVDQIKKAILERGERTINHGEGPQQVTKVIFGGTGWVSPILCIGAMVIAWGLTISQSGQVKTQASQIAVQQQQIAAQQAHINQLVRRLDRVEDYQLTSYMLLPELRKQIEANLNKRKSEK